MSLIVLLIILLLLFGGGVVLPLSWLPDQLASVLQYLPSAALADGLRAVWERSTNRQHRA